MKIEISSPYGKGRTKPVIDISGGIFDSPTAVARAYLEVEKALRADEVKAKKSKKGGGI